MRHRDIILLVNSAIYLILGLILLIYTPSIIVDLGLPAAPHPFFSNLAGGVFMGISIAFIIEYLKKPGGIVGVGLGGAVAINLCVGTVLVFWLMAESLQIPLRGRIFLWIVTLYLISNSVIEIIIAIRRKYFRRS
jgi:hypothetical protein